MSPRKRINVGERLRRSALLPRTVAADRTRRIMRNLSTVGRNATDAVLVNVYRAQLVAKAASIRLIVAQRASQARAEQKRAERVPPAERAKPVLIVTPSAAPEPVALRSAATLGLPIDGRALHRSIVPTWFMLVGLSWVSLIWGALISAPFGVGLAFFATMFANMIVVPAWGTLFGFLGMSTARDSTLRQMNFNRLGDDHPLVEFTGTLAASLGIPTPQVGTVPVFNAFAMGTNVDNATIAIGVPLMEALTTAETEAIIGHELGHVVSGDMRRMMLMRTFQNATVWFGVSQGLKQVARWIICWAAELAILAFSRQREYWADAIGAALTSKDAMISALRKLEQGPALSADERTHMRFMMRGKPLSTHPSTEQRIAALEAETYLQKLPRRS